MLLRSSKSEQIQLSRMTLLQFLIRAAYRYLRQMTMQLPTVIQLCSTLILFGSVSFIHALPLSCHVVSGCLFVCWSCPVCVEAVYRCSAMPCVLELLGGNLAPLPADKSDWHIHQFVRALIPWHIRSDLLAGQGCKNLSLSLSDPGSVYSRRFTELC